MSKTKSVEPRKKVITALLSRQGAMLEELKRIIGELDLNCAREEIRQLVIENNFLNRPSLSSRKEVNRKLSERYFRRNTPKLNKTFIQAIRSSSASTAFALLAYTMFLWNDALTLILGLQWLAPKLKGELFEAATSDIIRELDYLSREYQAITGWSEVTRKRVASHYLSLLRDCGFATGAAKKVLRKPYIPPQVILFGARLIIGGGETAEHVPEHMLFKAMGLEVDEVLENLYELNREGMVRFATQGGIVHLDFIDSESQI